MCNSQTNLRIVGFTEKFATIGIKKDAYYVDFISQTKIYDDAVASNNAEQFGKRFEFKKNIIMATKSLKNIDEIIEMANQFKIYDSIKIGYFSNNSSKI